MQRKFMMHASTKTPVAAKTITHLLVLLAVMLFTIKMCNPFLSYSCGWNRSFSKLIGSFCLLNDSDGSALKKINTFFHP